MEYFIDSNRADQFRIGSKINPFIDAMIFKVAKNYTCRQSFLLCLQKT